ncbi:MAG TPA: NADH-quinone oxidoreductase subunit N [Gemmatimonadales bacterium]|jgi:NADH-quinone oxidoreductase subunit N|nr:NADH-quinone oxidoreductase subunit N [Gemmatimonadales bacterium]
MRPLDPHLPLDATIALLPEVLLTLGALVVLLVNAWRHRTAADSRLAGWIALASLLPSAAALAALWQGGAGARGEPFMVALDGFRFAALALILVATAATILLSLGYLEREGMMAPEYYALILFAASGMMFLAGAEDLIVLFLGLEVMSVSVYVLAGYDRASVFSAEAALKYFLIGAFASAFLLYGIALVWGGTGSTGLSEIGTRLARGEHPALANLGLGLLLIGMGFKVASVPFHMWAPDVYDGAPTPVTGFMATGVKAASFLALARILYVGFPAATEAWQPVIAALAVASMVLGNLVALAQRSLKRMLAYSSIAHAGYLLTALWPGTRLGAGATLLYVAAYSLTSLAAFGILTVLGRGGERDVTLDSIAGLGRRRPWLAFGLAVCMLSLLGFPGTLGFVGKWAILAAVVQQKHLPLAVILVVTSLVSAGYYLPVIMASWMREPAGPGAHDGALLPRAAAVGVAVAVALVLAFGVLPASALAGAVRNAGTMVGSGMAAPPGLGR